MHMRRTGRSRASSSNGNVPRPRGESRERSGAEHRSSPPRQAAVKAGDGPGSRMTRKRNRRWNAMQAERTLTSSNVCEHLVGPVAVSPLLKILATTSVLINFRPPVDVHPLSQASSPPYINPDPSLRPNPNPSRPHSYPQSTTSPESIGRLRPGAGRPSQSTLPLLLHRPRGCNDLHIYKYPRRS